MLKYYFNISLEELFSSLYKFNMKDVKHADYEQNSRYEWQSTVSEKDIKLKKITSTFVHTTEIDPKLGSMCNFELGELFSKTKLMPLIEKGFKYIIYKDNKSILVKMLINTEICDVTDIENVN